MGIGSYFKRQITAIVQNTAVPVELLANPAGILLVTAAAGVPWQVEGTQAEGAVGAANPIQIAGRNIAGNVAIPDVNTAAGPIQFLYSGITNGTQLMPTGDALARRIFMTHCDGVQAMPAGDANARPIYHIITDTAPTDLLIATDNAVAVATGIHPILHYQAVQAVGADTDGMRAQCDAYGNAQGISDNRALGSRQVVEQAPPQYDVLRFTARASVVLTNALVVSAEIPTGGRKYCSFLVSYTRGAAGGRIECFVERALTIGGADFWGFEIKRNSAGFAKGGQSTDDVQGMLFDFQEEGGAGAYLFPIDIDIMRYDKVRISVRESSGLAVGTCAVYGVLSN